MFKHFDRSGTTTGVAIKGIENDSQLTRTLGKGYGLNVVVGDPPNKDTATKENPLKIIVFEAPIDLLSYYELHKESIGSCHLLCMNGLRKEVISRYLYDVLQSYIPASEQDILINKIQSSGLKTEKIQIVLAVDNDTAGNQFVDSFSYDWCRIATDQPLVREGKEKTDWNNILQMKKEMV